MVCVSGPISRHLWAGRASSLPLAAVSACLLVGLAVSLPRQQRSTSSGAGAHCCCHTVLCTVKRPGCSVPAAVSVCGALRLLETFPSPAALTALVCGSWLSRERGEAQGHRSSRSQRVRAKSGLMRQPEANEIDTRWLTLSLHVHYADSLGWKQTF